MREVNPLRRAADTEDRTMTHDLNDLRRAYEAQSTKCAEVLHTLRALTVDAGDRVIAIGDDVTSAFEEKPSCSASPSVPFTLRG